MTDYELMAEQLQALAAEEAYYIPVLSNASALIRENMDRLNWAGFYLMRGGRLVLGPFQGRPACIHIELGRGVCGAAAAEDRTVLVPNVHEFSGHIACDSASESEIVVPIRQNGQVIGVLDIDSPVRSRFTEEDRVGLELFVRTMEKVTEFGND